MTANRKTVREWILGASETQLDGLLEEYSFTRRKRALKYSRIYHKAHQGIELQFDLSPRYGQGADAHLIPWITVKIPEVNEVALEMVGNDALLANAPDLTLSQPLEFAAPPEHRTLLMFSGQEGARAVIHEVSDVLGRWGLQFLDNYDSARAIVTAFENDDPRVLKQRHWYVYVAASYLIEGEPRKALKTLEEKLGGVSSRVRYRQAFAYVDGQLGRMGAE